MNRRDSALPRILDNINGFKFAQKGSTRVLLGTNSGKEIGELVSEEPHRLAFSR